MGWPVIDKKREGEKEESQGKAARNSPRMRRYDVQYSVLSGNFFSLSARAFLVVDGGRVREREEREESGRSANVRSNVKSRRNQKGPSGMREEEEREREREREMGNEKRREERWK